MKMGRFRQWLGLVGVFESLIGLPALLAAWFATSQLDLSFIVGLIVFLVILAARFQRYVRLQKNQILEFQSLKDELGGQRAYLDERDALQSKKAELFISGIDSIRDRVEQIEAGAEPMKSQIASNLNAAAQHIYQQLSLFEKRSDEQDAAVAALKTRFGEMRPFMNRIETMQLDIDALTSQTNKLLGLEQSQAEIAVHNSRIETAQSGEAALNEQLNQKLEASRREFLTQAESLSHRASSLESGVTKLAERMLSAEQSLLEAARDGDVVRIGLRDFARTGQLPASIYTAGSFDPEVDVIPLLAQSAVFKRAIDVGANRGDFTQALRGSGFVVDAFEPLPQLVEELKLRFSGDDQVRVHGVAAGAQDSEANLFLVEVADKTVDSSLFSSLSKHAGFEGFDFKGGIAVSVRRIDELMAGLGTSSVDLLKVDTEGHDLDVLAGSAGLDARIIMVEFWDEKHPFNAGGTKNRLQDYLDFIDRNRYPFHVVMWRGLLRHDFGLSGNGRSTPEGSWGNILFLPDSSIYEDVLSWGRRTYGDERVSKGGET
jgi:FkbM family methyltransferase